MVPGLLWLSAASFLLMPYGQGIGLALLIAALGLFLYPDQPILTAALLDVVRHDAATTTARYTYRANP